MKQKQNQFDFPNEVKAKYLDEIIRYFQAERNEEIGIIAAEEFLDFFLDTVGGGIYSKAVEDCKKIMKEQIATIDLELDTLVSK